MSDRVRKLKNCHGSEIEIFDSGKSGKYAFVLTRSNGDQFSSREDLNESQVQELIACFDENEAEIIDRLNPDKYSATKIDWPTVILVGSFYFASLYLSGFDLKLAVIMIVPAAIILIKSHKKKSKTE